MAPSSFVPLRGPGRMASPRSASIPALLTSRSGVAFISDVSSRSWRPPTISGLRQHRVADLDEARRQLGSRGRRRDRGRVREHRVGPGDLVEREGVGLDAAAVDRGLEPIGCRAERPGHRRSVGDLRWMAGLPVVRRIPALQPATGGARRCAGPSTCAGSVPAFSPSRARRAAVSASRGIPSAPQARSAWLTPGPPVEALEGSDVEVLARVRAGEDRDLGRFEVEGLDPAGLDDARARQMA